MKLPPHECSLTIEHNEHKVVYEDLEGYLEHCDDDFQSDEHRQRALRTGELWVMRWYPETPVGSLSVAAPALDELLEWALEVGRRDAAGGCT